MLNAYRLLSLLLADSFAIGEHKKLGPGDDLGLVLKPGETQPRLSADPRQSFQPHSSQFTYMLYNTVIHVTFYIMLGSI